MWKFPNYLHTLANGVLGSATQTIQKYTTTILYKNTTGNLKLIDIRKRNFCIRAVRWYTSLVPELTLKVSCVYKTPKSSCHIYIFHKITNLRRMAVTLHCVSESHQLISVLGQMKLWKQLNKKNCMFFGHCKPNLCTTKSSGWGTWLVTFDKYFASNTLLIAIYILKLFSP